MTGTVKKLEFAMITQGSKSRQKSLFLFCVFVPSHSVGEGKVNFLILCAVAGVTTITPEVLNKLRIYLNSAELHG